MEVSPYLAFAAVPSLGSHPVEHVRTFVNVDPDLTPGYNLIAEFHFEPAIPCFEAVLARKAASAALRSEAATYLGYAWFNLRRPERATASLNQAVALNPANEMAHFYLANEHYLDGDPEGVKRELLKAVAIRASFVSAEAMLAELYRDEGNLAAAIQRYGEIVRFLPNSGYYRYQLYRACLDAGHYREARADLEAMVRLEPRFALNYYRLGDVDLKLGDPAAAQAAFRELAAVGGRPLEPLALLGSARLHLARGELVAARRDVERARKLRPDQPEMADTLALVEKRQGEVRATKVRRLLMGAGTFLALGLVGWSAALAQRKRHHLAVMARFSEGADSIYDPEEMGRFLVRFFADLLGRGRALLMVYHRQSNALSSAQSEGPDGEGSWRVVVGDEVPRLLQKWTRAWMPLVRLQSDAGFEQAFPSLAGRLLRQGYEALVPFREKGAFLGFLALGDPVPGKARAADGELLQPLATAAAQALETLHLYETSMVDQTTGLFNKRFFKQQLAVELKRADRYQQPCSVIAFDLDDFKKINEVYGHEAGDRVLRDLGQVVSLAIREGIDTAARTGGEEFHLVLPATSTERAETVAERLRVAVEERTVGGFSKAVRVTVSIGVATYPEHAATERDLVRKADAAQYQAKRAGKNRVVVAESRSAQETQVFAVPDALTSTDALPAVPARRFPVLESRFDALHISDEETGLGNFTFFSLRLREEVKRVGRSGFPCSLLVLRLRADLDDASRAVVLKQMGILLKETLRDGIDTPARLEGDDLAIILPETPVEKALRLADRLQRLIGGRAFYPLTEAVGASIGVASYPECATSDNHLLESALLALRNALDGSDGAVRRAPLLPPI